ncbi:hypothetical protein BXZ70DRAFT_487680 [Cristinia sonorae]|uniref:GST N-terminal domain-containing protein n=1 Tax=Cristinia sonorae TaxID=1940300 RepID=A0A8K0UHJ1_9AGAR|nr:hypothetical protein BXZ70DRAFT_487680 [Cristinia sonorae]
MSELIFYDIPGKSDASKAWSINTWNTRFALNFKGLKYKTEWVEYPDIEAVCKKIGAGPTTTKSDGVTPHYTLPVLYDPSTKAVVPDSTAIADYLDKTFPDTARLFPPGTRALYNSFADEFELAVMTPLFLLSVLATCRNLNQRSFEYFKKTRTEAYGDLESITPEGAEKTDGVWSDLERGLAKVAGWIETGGGAFLGGESPNYADIRLAAALIWGRIVLGRDSERWRRIISFDGGRWERFLDQFEPYTAVDN